MDATIFAALDRCGLMPNLAAQKSIVDVLKGAIKASKASSTIQYAVLRLGGNRASLLDQIEAVPEPYEAHKPIFYVQSLIGMPLLRCRVVLYASLNANCGLGLGFAVV